VAATAAAEAVIRNSRRDSFFMAEAIVADEAPSTPAACDQHGPGVVRPPMREAIATWNGLTREQLAAS
jgi:hypothetical protein